MEGYAAAVAQSAITAPRCSYGWKSLFFRVTLHSCCLSNISQHNRPSFALFFDERRQPSESTLFSCCPNLTLKKHATMFMPKSHWIAIYSTLFRGKLFSDVFTNVWERLTISKRGRRPVSMMSSGSSTGGIGGDKKGWGWWAAPLIKTLAGWKYQGK